MELATFKSVIQAIPVLYLGYRAKRKTWRKHMADKTDAAKALKAIFDGADEVMLSRDDLRRLAAKQDLSRFVMATIVWGYPGGMINPHYVTSIAKGLDTVLDALRTARDDGIENWMKHHKAWRSVHGLGLSTYSKLLHFLSVQVNGREALILDSRIIDVIKFGLFEELQPLQNRIGALGRYPGYLELMHEVAAKLEVDARALEFFLYDFGLKLKPPKSNAAIALAVPTNGAR